MQEGVTYFCMHSAPLQSPNWKYKKERKKKRKEVDISSAETQHKEARQSVTFLDLTVFHRIKKILRIKLF